MEISENYTHVQWRGAIARIAAQIADLMARIDTVSAETATLQAELRDLEAEVSAAGADGYARQIALQIERLRAKGDAAYALLQTSMATQLDPADAEIRLLEAVAAIASGDAKGRMIARVDELKAARMAAHGIHHADEWTAGRPRDVPQ